MNFYHGISILIKFLKKFHPELERSESSNHLWTEIHSFNCAYNALILIIVANSGILLVLIFLIVSRNDKIGLLE